MVTVPGIPEYPDLAELARLWPTIPEAVRKSIVVMAKDAARKGSDDHLDGRAPSLS